MKQQASLMVKCPNCGKTTEWDTQNTYRPFCSEHCKLIDLGAWASEQYSIPTQQIPANEEKSSDLD